jgi:hypothetical protein
VHDYFEILGLPSDAPASEVRRACARRICGAPGDAVRPAASPTPPSPRWLGADAAIDFVDVAALLDRIQAAFFAGSC